MRIVSLFNGEERQSRGVTTLEEIRVASIDLPIGDGWGQMVRGAVAELRRVGAYENRYGGWLIAIDSGHLPCEVEAAAT